MSNENPSCQVVLFPLCDPRGALSEVLNNPEASGTRLNALILAWRLDLSETVSLSAAASAMLTVAAAAQPAVGWTERQLRLLAELRRISESTGTHRPNAEWRRLLKRGGSNVKTGQRKTRTKRVSPECES